MRTFETSNIEKIINIPNIFLNYFVTTSTATAYTSLPQSLMLITIFPH